MKKTRAERLNEIEYQEVRIRAIDRRLEGLDEHSKARVGLLLSRKDALREIKRLSE